MFQSLCLVLSFVLPVLAGLRDLGDCDPLRKDKHCPPDPAFASASSFSFDNGTWDDKFEAFWEVDQDTSNNRHRLDFNTDGKGFALEIQKTGEAPTLTSRRYIFFGKVTVEVQAAKGPGLITAIVLKSDSGDEIDWELLGAFDNQATSNYFYDGQALYNTYNNTYYIKSSSYDAFHKYSVEWTDTAITFAIDDVARKAWCLGAIPPGKWPQVPMHVKIGVWSVNPALDVGEVEWAGGVPDWSKGPVRAYFRNVNIVDYMGGCTEAESGNVIEYAYDERTRGWKDVKVEGCENRTEPGLHTPQSVAITAKPTAGPTATERDDGATRSSASKTKDEASPTEKSDEGDDDKDSSGIVKSVSSIAAVLGSLCWLVL